MSQRPVAIVAVAVPEDLLILIQKNLDIHIVPAGQRVEEVLPPAVAQRAVGLLCSLRTPIGQPLFDALPALRVVSNYAVGFDNVDVHAANRSGVLVCNTPGVLDAAVADLTFGLILCLGRKMLQLDRFARDGSWIKGAAPLSSDLSGKTLGLLGMGRIGRMVAQRAKAFGMHAAYHNRRRDTESEQLGLATYVERQDLFKTSDFVSIHVPLSAETRHSIGAAELAAMKSTAYLVNTSRGPVLDEEALIAALMEGKIAGAGLDVMVKEPLESSSPLASLPNVVLQPHVGSATVETRRAMMSLAVANLVDATGGVRPRAMVNESAWPIARKGTAHV